MIKVQIFDGFVAWFSEVLSAMGDAAGSNHQSSLSAKLVLGSNHSRLSSLQLLEHERRSLGGDGEVFLLPRVALVPTVGLNPLVKGNLLPSDILDFLGSSAVSLSSNSLGKVEVVNESLLGVNLNLDVINFFLSGLLLSLETLLRLEGHTNLAELKHDFEIGVEVVQCLLLKAVADGLQESTLLAVHIHVNFVSNFRDPCLLLGRWVASLNGGIESFSAREYICAIDSIA